MLIRRLAFAGLAGLTSLVALGGAGILLLPSEIQVRRSREVRAPIVRIVPAIAHFEERLSWIPWTTQDPEATYTFEGTAGQPGSQMAWSGEVIGAATVELVSVDASSVVTRITYREPMSLETTDRFEFRPLPNGHTEVTWINEGPAPMGPARVFALLADGILGPDYEEGLRRLDLHLAGPTAGR
jgi:hypothetical protein